MTEYLPEPRPPAGRQPGDRLVGLTVHSSVFPWFGGQRVTREPIAERWGFEGAFAVSRFERRYYDDFDIEYQCDHD